MGEKSHCRICCIPDNWDSVFFFFIFSGISLLMVIGYIGLFLGVPLAAVYLNQRHNISKSIAFIERDGKYYAVWIVNTVEGESNAFEQDDSISEIKHSNIDNEFIVHADEQAILEIRNNLLNFSIALDDIQDYLKRNPSEYEVLPDCKRKRNGILFKYGVENYRLARLETKKAAYGFLILNNPRIVFENTNVFVIAFDNENGEECTAKFTNCYNGFIEEIKKKSQI